jgi:hypothetical protein
MKYEKSRPQEGNVEKPNQAKEQWHVDAVLIANAFLHDDSVEAVHYGASKGHGIPNCDLSL